jgi:putative NADPH-quinone reductase
MLVQVVHCHPVAESYSHALFETILAALERGGHQAITTDLYRRRFDPALSEHERRNYFHEPYPDDAVSAYTAALRRAEGIIFNFPQWWFAPPALLKGYFDRVWTPGTAFEHDLAGGRIKPLLTHIRLFGVVTSYGSPWWITKLAGDPGRKMLLRGLKPMCGAGVRSFYLAHYDMDRSTAATRQAFIERVRATISAL